MADYESWRDYYNPQDRDPMKARNVFEFIGKQSLFSKVFNKLKGA